jgi:hypothetical protein
MGNSRKWSEEQVTSSLLAKQMREMQARKEIRRRKEELAKVEAEKLRLQQYEEKEDYGSF